VWLRFRHGPPLFSVHEKPRFMDANGSTVETRAR
jgi:hypothetical protein